MLAPQILTRTTDWPRLGSAHPQRGRGSPQKFKVEHIKLGLKFRVCGPITLGLAGATSRNFSTRRTARQGCSNCMAQFWGRPAPWNLGWQKRLKFSATSDNFRVWSQISQNRSTYRKSEKNLINNSLQPIPCWAKKDCELWSTNKKVIDLHVDPPKLNFSTDYISALRECWPLKF